MKLRQLCNERYIPSCLRIRHDHTKAQYQFMLNDLRAFLGREAETSDLNDDTLIAFMRWLRDHRKLCVVTVNNRRTRLVALWNWLAKRRIVEQFPTVPPIPEPKRTPRAWTVEQLAKLIHACRCAPGNIGTARASDWWLALHAYLWDTGARTSETLALEWEWYDTPRRTFFVPAECRKGQRKDAAYIVAEDTAMALAVLRAQTQGPRVFGGIGHASAFWKRYETLLRRAGLPTGRYSGPQKMRRSHATWLKALGGDATASLMHGSDQVTREFYEDPTITQESPAKKLFRILPPPDDRKAS